jgi:flavin reductase (DIM6/NTAB) family NADH-FMN oxidoreductase RutF
MSHVRLVERPAEIPVAISSTEFRAALRQLAGAVSVITARHGEQRSGLVATSVTGLSADPATLLVCVNQGSSTFPLIRDAGVFAVNVLPARHQDLAERFSGRHGHKGDARYEGVRWSTLETGAPILSDALVALDCEVEEIVPRHSHGIVIGRIRATATRPGEASLLYWQGGYRALLAD